MCGFARKFMRVYDGRGKATADLLSLDDEDARHMERILLHHPTEYTTHRALERGEVSEAEPLLVDVLKDGRLVYDLPSVEDIRARRQADVERLDPGVRRLVNPHVYHVSLTERLWELKQELMRCWNEGRA